MQEEYNKEDIQALICMHMTLEEGDVENYELEEDSWQISYLVNTDTFDISSDTGRIWTERMKIM